MKKLSVVTILICLSACTSINRMLKTDPNPMQADVSRAPKLYQTAMLNIGAGNFEECYRNLSQFILEDPASAWIQVAVFNRGRCAQELKDWSNAAENYEIVARNAGASAPRLQALAMLRALEVYEELGSDDKLIAMGTDLERRTRFLSPVEAEAELPARMASAFARRGETIPAEEYFAKSEKAIYKFRVVEKNGATDWMAKSFLAMGRSIRGQPNWKNVEAFVGPVQRSQKYLVQAIELEVAPWSMVAMKDLESFYEGMWSAIQIAPHDPSSEDQVLERREHVEKQVTVAVDLYEGILDLDRLRAATNPGEAGKRLKEFLIEFRVRLDQLLDSARNGNDLTAAGKARIYEIKGRTIDPNPVLEQKTKRK